MYVCTGTRAHAHVLGWQHSRFDMLDEGLALYFDDKVSGSHWTRIPGRGRFFQRCVSWSVDGFEWQGDPLKVRQVVALMETAGCRSSAVPGTKATGQGRRDADGELEGSVVKFSAGVGAHYAHQHGSARSAAQLEDGDEHDCEGSGGHESRLRKIARHLEDSPAVEYVYGYQSEVTACMEFGDSDCARDRESPINIGGAERDRKPLH